MKGSARKALGALLLALALPVGAQMYVDKVLDEGNQPALVLTPELSRSSGWPRGWRVEYNIAKDSGAQSGVSKGISFSGFLDTPNHGALSLSASVSRADQADGLFGERIESSSLWRLDQRGLPLEGGWLANHSAGDLTSLQVPMARGFGRIGLPSSPLEGVTAEYVQRDSTLLNASVGRPGLYSGLGVNGFNPARGRLAFAGAQQSLTGSAQGSSVAVQMFDASGTPDTTNPNLDQSVRGLWSAWRWEGTAPWASGITPGTMPAWQREGGLQLQVNAMTSRSSGGTDAALHDGGAGNGKGAWLDAQWRSQWLQQAAGAFYLQPSLRWGTYNAISDIRGAYWRGDVSTRRWQLSTSTEWTDSVSGATGANLFANVSGRYRVDTHDTALAGLSVRRLASPGTSAQVGWEHTSDLGQTQWVADLLRAGTRRSMRLGIDHSFLLAADSALALTAAVERVEIADRMTRTFSWGVVGSTRLGSNLSLDANLRGSQASTSRQVSGTMGVAWSIVPNWTLLAQFSSVRGEDLEQFALVSSLTQAAAAATPVVTARRVQLTLRYEDRAGSVSAPLGGAPGMGGGSVQGTIFFDADNNGRREASEGGVPNVVVLLDRRFVARTDAQGRYEFPWVAAGEHTLQVQTDNVPLPWNPVQRDAVPITVLVRSTTTTDFALQRDR